MQICRNTQPGSVLRRFVAASLLFQLRSPDYVEDGKIIRLLKSNDDLLMSVLGGVRSLQATVRDPRVRDCMGDGECHKCLEGFNSCAGKLKGKDGYWPCDFHSHTVEDAGCHLWGA